MQRLVALLLGCVLAGVMITLGLVLTVRILFPEWYAVPAAVLQMTGQKVPAPPRPAEPIVQFDQRAPTPGASRSAPRPTATSVTAPIARAATPTAAATDTPAAQSQDTETAGLLLPNRRFNVLLLGSDNDLKFSPNAVLSQSIILVSIDPAAPDVAMISIPRDFWVPIANYGYQKIDVAYEVGGIALARSTVEKLFGITIDYYAWIGLNGLVQVVDTLGGVDVTVQHPILDEMYPDDLDSANPYAFLRLYIPAGPQHLDGTTALQYVRSRHGDLQSDFGRSARQQQVLLAINNRLQTLSVLSRVPQLVADLQGSVKTDLSLPALLQLVTLGRKLPPERIHQQVLSAPEFASLGYSPDGTQQVVYPDWAAIRRALARLLEPALLEPALPAPAETPGVAEPVSTPSAARPAAPTPAAAPVVAGSTTQPARAPTSLTWLYVVDGNLWQTTGSGQVQLTRDGVIGQPVLGDNGLVFVERSRYATDVWLASAEGPPRPITRNTSAAVSQNHWASQPVFVAENQRLYVLGDFNKLSTGPGDLAVWQLGFGQELPVQITRPPAYTGGDQDVTVDPHNPGRIVFTRYAYVGAQLVEQLQWLDVSTDTLVPLTAPGQPSRQASYSPDATELAFVQRDGGHEDLYVAHLQVIAGRAQLDEPRKVVSGVVANPVWSADGNTLAYLALTSNGFQLWSVDIQRDADGGETFGEPRQLTAGASVDATSRPVYLSAQQADAVRQWVTSPAP